MERTGSEERGPGMKQPERVLLMVGYKMEESRAKDQGWQSFEIIYPILRQLEGRRWDKLFISWAALPAFYPDIAYRLESDQLRQMSKIEIVSNIPFRSQL